MIIKLKTRKTNFQGFYEILCTTIKSGKKGIYGDIIKYAPSFFKLLCKILSDERTDWHTKLVIDAALAYFVVPNDIVPEDKYNVIGYVDDIFVCAYALKEIKEVSKELLVDNWDDKGNILEIVDNLFSQSKRIIGDKYKEILQFTGLMRKDKKSVVEKDHKESDILLSEIKKEKINK